jgi:hypothetical protein
MNGCNEHTTWSETWRKCLALVCLGLMLAGKASGADRVDAVPVTPGASPEVQSLLAFLADNYGRNVISGQQDGSRSGPGESFEIGFLRATTGKLPALRSFDLGGVTLMKSLPTEFATTRHAREWYAQSNGLVSLCWHWPAPDNSGKFYTKDTQFDMTRALAPDSPEHAALLRDLDIVAAELAKLRDAHVPVLWRPLHEANGRWFWWGASGPESFRRLWRLMYERFTEQHKLNNLLWVFSPGASVDLNQWYPGDAYVDIIGYDHYTMEPSLAPAKNVFDELDQLVAHRKILAMSENGQLPDLDRVFQEKAVWAWFTTWSGDLVKRTPTNQLAAIYNDARVLTVDELPDLKNYPFRRAGSAARLAILAPTSLPINGEAARPVTVLVQDADGLMVCGGRREVKLSVAGETFTANTLNGIATFEKLKCAHAGKGVVLKASSEGLESASSQPLEVGPGDGLVREWWTNVNGHTVASLTNHPAFPKSPAGREVLSRQLQVEYRAATNYGARIFGWLIPPLSGSYEFDLVSDGASELWLSTNDPVAAKIKLSEITDQTPYSKWPHSHEVWSAPVALEAGRRYYLEALHVQNAGGISLSIRWRLPNSSTDEIIPASRLATSPAEKSATKTANVTPALHAANQ